MADEYLITNSRTGNQVEIKIEGDNWSGTKDISIIDERGFFKDDSTKIANGKYSDDDIPKILEGLGKELTHASSSDDLIIKKTK